MKTTLIETQEVLVENARQMSVLTIASPGKQQAWLHKYNERMARLRIMQAYPKTHRHTGMDHTDLNQD
jgi:hypothetical protein